MRELGIRTLVRAALAGLVMLSVACSTSNKETASRAKVAGETTIAAETTPRPPTTQDDGKWNADDACRILQETVGSGSVKPGQIPGATELAYLLTDLYRGEVELSPGSDPNTMWISDHDRGPGNDLRVRSGRAIEAGSAPDITSQPGAAGEYDVILTASLTGDAVTVSEGDKEVCSILLAEPPPSVKDTIGILTTHTACDIAQTTLAMQPGETPTGVEQFLSKLKSVDEPVIIGPDYESAAFRVYLPRRGNTTTYYRVVDRWRVSGPIASPVPAPQGRLLMIYQHPGVKITDANGRELCLRTFAD
jgi:hypothetical protein